LLMRQVESATPDAWPLIYGSGKYHSENQACCVKDLMDQGSLKSLAAFLTVAVAKQQWPAAV